MIGRRIAAYSIDLALFVLVIYVSLLVGGAITSQFLSVVVVTLMILILEFILFGVVSVLVKGSIGKKIMDLKVLPTFGLITPIRLFIRDALVKYLPYLPITIGLYLLIKQPFDNRDVFMTLMQASIVMLVLLLIVTLYNMATKHKTALDEYFNTMIDNDIPTAQEYDDLQGYIEGYKK